MKGDMSLYMYMVFVVIIGIVLLIAVMSRMNPAESPTGRAKELAINIALHVNSLSTVEEGSAVISTSNHKYDIEIKKDGYNFLAFVYPYEGDGKKLDPASAVINAYKIDGSYGKLIINASKVCITKSQGENAAMVSECGKK